MYNNTSAAIVATTIAEIDFMPGTHMIDMIAEKKLLSDRSDFHLLIRTFFTLGAVDILFSVLFSFCKVYFEQ